MTPPAGIKVRKGSVLHAILILLACIAALAGAFLLTLIGPKNTLPQQDTSTQVRKELSDLDRRSQDLWETFSNLVEFKKELDDEDMKILDEALALREQYMMDAGNPYDPILEGIRKKSQTLKAEKYREKSMELEEQGNAARDKNDFASAEKFYAEAMALEQRISDECQLSGKKNISRTTGLTRLNRTMQARPIWDESHALEKEGDDAAEAKTWSIAAAKYQEAFTREKLLREKFYGMLPLDHYRLEKLLIKIDTARSSPAHDKISDQIESATKFADLGDTTKSEAAFKQAIDAQEDLAKEFPKSKYATKEVAQKLKQTRDLTLSTPILVNLREGLVKLDQLIRERKSDDAGTQALLLLRDATRLRDNFPDANAVEGETIAKLQYINFKSRDIALVQDRFLSTLKPVPGQNGTSMSYTEIPQVLYTAIMENANPSATRGDALPVDSVAYGDAEEFCRRISWLTGRTVRLPNESEFRAALGTVRPAEVAKQAWSIENSDGQTKPVATMAPNENGFNDLLGNVGEWLLSTEKGTAMEIGGNSQTSIDQIASVPLQSVIKVEKSRLRGFRVVSIEEPAAK